MVSSGGKRDVNIIMKIGFIQKSNNCPFSGQVPSCVKGGCDPPAEVPHALAEELKSLDGVRPQDDDWCCWIR